MNSIATDQNTPLSLELLAAQRQLYSRAKAVFVWQFVLSGPVASALAVIVLLAPTLRSFAALWGVLLVIADLVLFTPWQKTLKTTAARIQEQFDCVVLQLPWNVVKAGSRPTCEQISKEANAYLKNEAAMPKLQNWYPVAIAPLPLHFARLVCQRQNCWWDSNQRKTYATVLLSTVAGMFGVLFVASLYQGLTMARFVLGVFVPLAPILVFGLRQHIEHRDAVARLEELRSHAESFWKDALAGHPEVQITAKSRILQDEIFDNRKKNPLVLDVVFAHFRDDNERYMNVGADQLVREALERRSR